MLVKIQNIQPIRFKRYNPYEYKKIVEDKRYVANRQKSYLTK